uniref:DoxX family protein n=1 Tax=mine drainage metagenome TaxID=410659 RepID=E6PER1_9ZZZZ
MHWSIFLGVAQLAIGLLLLVIRYVPVALIMLAVFAYNSFAFHITMMPAGLPAPIVVSILGYVVALPYRASFMRLFNDRGEGADKS